MFRQKYLKILRKIIKYSTLFYRKIQSSFGWDIAPAYPSVGIYKPIYLEAFAEASIQYVTFVTKKLAGQWQFVVKVYLDTKTTFEVSFLNELLMNYFKQFIKVPFLIFSLS